MTSLKNKIKLHLKSQYPKWIMGAKLEDFGRDKGYSASNSSRRCRDLRTEGYLESREENGLVHYRYIPEPQELKEIEILRTGQQQLLGKTLF